MTCFSWFK